MFSSCSPWTANNDSGRNLQPLDKVRCCTAEPIPGRGKALCFRDYRGMVRPSLQKLPAGNNNGLQMEHWHLAGSLGNLKEGQL